jgi:integrase
MARRAKGEGSIFKRKDGLWQGAVTIGYDANGKQKRKTIYGKTRNKVRTKIDELKQRVAMGSISTDDPTLEAFLERWLIEKARQVKPRTVESYRYTVERYILPKLGRERLSKITPFRIQTALGEIADEVSPHTSNYCRSTLQTAFEQAVKWQVLSINPAKGVTRVRQEKREMTVWEDDETTRFLDHAANHRLYPLFYLAITSGLRIGELLGLRWEDLTGNVLQVRHSLTKQGGKLMLASTKTRKGRRPVALAQDTLDILEAHRLQQRKEQEFLGSAWEQPGHMFVSELGTFLDHRNVLRVWHRLQKEADVPRIRLHDARHLHVSLLVRFGLELQAISDRVGHTNPTVTLGIYSHLFENQRLETAVPLKKLLMSKNAEEDSGKENT